MCRIGDCVCQGLSPLVRGKQAVAGSLPHPAGSIPACAGETQTEVQCRLEERVYPRLCGGNHA